MISSCPSWRAEPRSATEDRPAWTASGYTVSPTSQALTIKVLLVITTFPHQLGIVNRTLRLPLTLNSANGTTSLKIILTWNRRVDSIPPSPSPVHPSNQFPKNLSSTSTAFPPFNLSSIPAACTSLRPSLLPYLLFRNKAVIGFFTSISLHSDPSHTPWRHSSS